VVYGIGERFTFESIDVGVLGDQVVRGVLFGLFGVTVLLSFLFLGFLGG